MTNYAHHLQVINLVFHSQIFGNKTHFAMETRGQKQKNCDEGLYGQ